MSPKHPEARVIGLDIGTSAAKGVLLDQDGRVLAQSTRAYPVSRPRPGWSEQDPETWWAAAEAILTELGHENADGIGLTGQMHGLVVVDDGGRPLRPAILWNDGRSQPQADEVEQQLGIARLIVLGGNRVLAGFTAPKLRWLAQHEPKVHSAIRRILLPKDYIRLRLCGEFATDVSDASGTCLLDVAGRAWSDELSAVFGVDPAWLPRLYESAAISGHTRAGVPVAAGAGDQAAGALGAGVLDEAGPASVVLGTSGAVFAARDRYIPEQQGRLHVFCHAAPERWHAMSVMLSAAGALSWAARVLGYGDQSIPDLLRSAAEWTPGAGGLLFAPYLSGERTPYADSRVRSAFIGLGLEHDRGAMLRAVLEGVAHGMRDGLDLVAQVGRRPSFARVSGGGTRSELWCRILAAVLNLPLEVLESEAGAAYGAGLLGGQAAGVYGDPTRVVSFSLKVSASYEPDPEWTELYALERERYRALYPAVSQFVPPAAESGPPGRES